MNTRQARPDDLPILAPLFDAYRQFYRQPADLDLAHRFLKARISRQESVIFLALDRAESRGLGFVQLYPSFSSVAAMPTWILHDLFVDESVRQQGVARALMEAARRLALASDADGLSLSTATDNLRAQALYEDLGYVRDREFFHYFLPLSDDD
ncbi:MAG: GNAT family N-acetyltransferase [Gammaproteobacteria bacterium]